MGFFSDLKDDLSQAVNELMPEEELQAALEEDASADEAAELSGKVPTQEDLSNMLDEMDSFTTEEEAEPDIVSEPDAFEEPAEDEVVIEGDELEELAALTEPEDMLSGEEFPEDPASEDLVEEELPEEPVSEETDFEEAVSEDPVPDMSEEQMIDFIPDVDTSVKEEEQAEAEALLQEKEREDEKMEMEMEMDVQEKTVSDETAVVTEGMSITGDITSGGSLELIGNVIGNIDILGKLNITGGIQGNSRAAEIYAEGARINGEINSGGSVKIGQSSVVIGNINASSAVIAGAVKGDIDVHGPVVLDTSAIVMGNIKSKSVQINNGAVIEGMCSQCYADVNPTSFFEEIKKNKEKGKNK